MKICFVSKECAGLRGGGIGTYIAEAGKALRAHGHEVHLMTTLWNPDQERRLLAELPFDRVILAGEGVANDQRRRFFHADPHYGYAYLVHQTLQALQAAGTVYDYIEFADYEAEGLVVFQEQRQFATYAGTSLGLMLHSPTWECYAYDGQVHRATLHIRETCNIEEEAIRIAPFVNSPSHGLKDEVLRRLGIERDVAIIRYPMDFGPAPVVPTPPRQRLEDLAILYYGRIEPRKGIQELIDAFRELPECRLTLIGGDVPYSPYGKSYREYLERTAPPNVQFQSPMPRPQLLERLRDADVCIFPSRFENWPNTCIEAMAAGRVVIGSKHGGMGEMIEHGVSGFHVDGRSSADIVRVFREDLAAALGRLDRIGLAAAERIRRFSEQKRYCDALMARIDEQRRLQPAARRVDHEAHKVSVIVPFYKDRETVDATIDAICRQTHRNLEILIVDDGSPLPDAPQILARQAAKDPRVRVLHKPNGGLGSARNFGIAQATGEFLLFCDADNLPRPDYARAGVEILVRLPDRHFVAPQNHHFRHSDGGSNGTYNALPFDRKSCLLTNRYGDAGAFFRRSVFVDHGLRYDEVLISYEDWALWMDCCDRGILGETVPRVLYDYRVRDDSMMRQDGWPNHAALMGWLIQYHYPKATQGERDILTTLFQHCGQSIARVASGHPDHLPPAPPASPPAAPPAKVAAEPKPPAEPRPEPRSAPAVPVPEPSPTPRADAMPSPALPSTASPAAQPVASATAKGGGLTRLVRKLFGGPSRT